MSSANLDLVRSICAAWERGDYSSVDWADPQIEFVIADGPEPGSFTGLAGLTGLRDFQNAWQEYHSEAIEYRELDEDRVLVLTYASGRGKASGLEVASMRANVFHLRAAKVTRLIAYWDRDRAFADLGLAREEPARAPEALSLSTMCTCGHPRRDHRGLRMEATGACLECACAEFTRARAAPESHEDVLEMIRAALDRVDRMQEIVAGLSTQSNDDVLNGDEVLDRQEWLALRRDFCGEELQPSTHLQVEEDGDVGLELARAESPPGSARLRIRHCRRATIVAIGRVSLYVAAREAMLVLALGDRPVERWRVLWRSRLDTPARPDDEPIT